MSGAEPKSLPLILAREFSANLATPMFLIDARGVLVFYNDAAAMLIGKPFGELGEIPGEQFGKLLDLATPEGAPVRISETPAGIAFFKRQPCHKTLVASTYNGSRLMVEATAYPLFGTTGEMHGVISVFWEHRDDETPD